MTAPDSDAVGTTDWYDANGATFFARTADAGMDDDRARFRALLPGPAVLDAGCGSGRDALAFTEAGLDVSAFDGSATMVALAARHTGLPVRHMRFQDMDWDGAFDGVWACASLLHVASGELADVLGRIRRALRPQGVFYASFKLGPGERWREGRRFTDMDEAALRPMIEAAGLSPLAFWVSEDTRPDAFPKAWVCVLARRDG